MQTTMMKYINLDDEDLQRSVNYLFPFHLFLVFFVLTFYILFKMMLISAIIDIDGNNWSTWFGLLLCINSVVIKVRLVVSVVCHIFLSQLF